MKAASVQYNVMAIMTVERRTHPSKKKKDTKDEVIAEQDLCVS